jgi:mRNA interferase HicA
MTGFPMNRREFERHLHSHGCHLHRHGAKHDIWINPANGRKAGMPRHTAITPGVVRSVCRKFGIPLPGGA